MNITSPVSYWRYKPHLGRSPKNVAQRTRAALVAIHSGSPKQWVNSAAARDSAIRDDWDDIWLVVTGTMDYDHIYIIYIYMYIYRHMTYIYIYG